MARSLLLGAILSAALMPLSTAGAQTAAGTGDPVPLELARPEPGKEWVLLDPLGAAFQVPRRTTVVHRPDSTSPHLLLRDGSASPSWSLRAEIVKPPVDAATGQILEAAEAVILGPDVLGSAAPDDILAQQARHMDDRLAHEAWVRQTLSDGAQVAFGWLAVPRTDGQVMLFTAVTTLAMLDLARPIVDTIFESIVPMDTPQALSGANAAIDRGMDVLASIDRHRLESLIGLRRVLRIWTPTRSGGAQELGFGILTVEAAAMDSVRPEGSPPVTAPDQPSGILVTLHLRYAIDPVADKYLDQIARMWMAWDGSHERWYLNSTKKQRGIQAKDTEIGVRAQASAGQPRQSLVVIRQDDAGARAPYENQVPRGWLPRPLEWLMADLAPRRDAPLAAWPAWDKGSVAPRMLLRRDRWDPNPDGSWTLTTWEGMDALPSRTLVSRRGPLSTSKPDGTRIDVTTDEAIATLWQGAGLKLR